MDVLWLAILLYSIGLAIVLHFRPALMFHPNGTWKEFGYQRSAESRYTIFPFWLFSVVWAFVSYALASALSWIWFPAAAAVTMEYTSNYDMRPIGSPSPYEGEYDGEMDMDMDLDMDEMMPVSQTPSQAHSQAHHRPRGRPKGSKSKPRQGYYVLDPTSRETGLQRYIYYGPSPPPTE